MYGTRRGRLSRYIIIIALYIYFHDIHSIFNIFSVSQSLLDKTLRLTVCYMITTSLLFLIHCFRDFVFLFLLQKKIIFPPSFLKTGFSFLITTATELSLKEKRSKSRKNVIYDLSCVHIVLLILLFFVFINNFFELS